MLADRFPLHYIEKNVSHIYFFIILEHSSLGVFDSVNVWCVCESQTSQEHGWEFGVKQDTTGQKRLQNSLQMQQT